MEKKTMKISMDFGKIFEEGKVQEVEVPMQKDRTAEIRKEEIKKLQKQKMELKAENPD